jgi:hypothetical protein
MLYAYFRKVPASNFGLLPSVLKFFVIFFGPTRPVPRYYIQALPLAKSLPFTIRDYLPLSFSVVAQIPSVQNPLESNIRTVGLEIYRLLLKQTTLTRLSLVTTV